MKNTGIVYSSTDKTPVVLPELAGLLPPLSGEQLAVLEEDLRENGCYSPLIIDENLTVIDGHNRHTLCEKHGIPYQMQVFHFDDTLEAMKWAVDTQKGRRNLDKWELGKIALKLKPALEAKAKANMSAGDGSHGKNQKSQQGSKDTQQELANSVGIGRQTMGRIMQIDEKAPQAVKDALDQKEISINQAYQITRQIQELPEKERAQAARLAVEEEKIWKKLRKSDAEIDRRAKISKQFCDAFAQSFELQPTEENIGYWVDFCCMRTRNLKEAIDEARVLSRLYASIEKKLREMYPEASAALDADDAGAYGSAQDPVRTRSQRERRRAGENEVNVRTNKVEE